MPLSEDPAERAPVSPCIGICLIDPATGVCRGCLRNVVEIANWYEASATEKRAILALIDKRRRPTAAGGRRNSE